MDSKLEKIQAADLKLGMYVERLDRPWTETPFLFQGFFVHHEDEIAELKRYCEFVYIDTVRGPDTDPAIRRPAERQDESRTITGVTNLRQPHPEPPPPEEGRRKRETYENALPMEQELAAAKDIHQEATRAAKDILTRLQQDGTLDVAQAEQAVEPMMESMLRNPDAMIWLTRMRQQSAYIYMHSVNSSIWGIAFARHLGLVKDSIFEIGLGCLLFDVGKTALSNLLLNKPGALTEAEMRVAHSHVDHSIAILKRTSGVTDRVMAMVRSHHERFDGSGYPDGLKGKEIPTFAKIAAMVDCYDALVSVRPYATQRTPFQAVREIYEWRGTLFQPEVVEQFMQVVGIFPTGSLVELNTGAVGVVISQNEARRLRPRIMLVLDDDKQQLRDFRIVDLLHDLPWSDSKKYWVERPLEAGAHGIDPQELYL